MSYTSCAYGLGISSTFPYPFSVPFCYATFLCHFHAFFLYHFSLPLFCVHFSMTLFCTIFMPLLCAIFLYHFSVPLFCVPFSVTLFCTIFMPLLCAFFCTIFLYHFSVPFFYTIFLWHLLDVYKLFSRLLARGKEIAIWGRMIGTRSTPPFVCYPMFAWIYPPHPPSLLSCST